MSSSTYTKALIYDKSFTTIEANTSGIRWEGDKPKIRVRRLVNASVISGPTASALECAPQGSTATFSRGMQGLKPVNWDTWIRGGTLTTRMIYRLESKFQLIPVCTLDFLRLKNLTKMHIIALK